MAATRPARARRPAGVAGKRGVRVSAGPLLRSYPPVLPRAGGVRPHTLILGTMPSAASLRAGEYYAHPQNAFWSIVADVLGFERGAVAYAERLTRLADAGYLLWDVLATCKRAGSLDAAIHTPTPNDVAGLLGDHPTVTRIVFNGQAAATFFRRHSAAPGLLLVVAPSTSPAYTLPYAAKLENWRRLVFAPPLSS
jgi:double-stranded uracil-DNA glycosylase